MSCFSEKDLVNIYRDLSKNKSYEEGAKALAILSYLEEENINFEEYLNIRDISYKKLVLKKSYMLEELNLVKNNQFKKVGLALSFPDFFIMGYLGSYYYIKIKNNKKEAYLFIKNFFDSCNQQSNARFNKFIDGVIQFFKSTFDISDIEQSFYKVTKRNIERETSKLSIYTKKNDIISIVILLKNKKESIWDLNQQHLNSILSILKDIEISNCKNTFKIEELFNCNISDLIFWWRAAYLAN
ncbi:hypothetical protein ABHA01_14320 [Clostridium paraputrificum]|uniref:hypothetical protein n=1 Tax=Clostridium paraputrificum TaxID=29363 RepID=UPI00325A8B79